MYKHVIDFIRELYKTNEFIPLHEPRFVGNEKKYLNECIDSTFVSSVGQFVDRFEDAIVKHTGAKYAVATVNGTAALHIALILARVKPNDEVITQALTFVATCNAIKYVSAIPILIDVDRDTLSLSPKKLEHFLAKNTEIINSECINIKTKRRIKAVVPMHTFGFPAKLDELLKVCEKYHLKIIEDAAESLGSFYKQEHTGTLGLLGTLSFNGNKTITTGGGGMIITNDESLANKAKHLTTTAKIPHRWEFVHDKVGYNYRLPNINAAIGCAQMENLDMFIKKKRKLAEEYISFFKEEPIKYITEPNNTQSNYWLNTILVKDEDTRNNFLKETNDNNVMTRPIWKLMNHLPMYRNVQKGNLENARWLEDRIINIPSSVRI